MRTEERECYLCTSYVPQKQIRKAGARGWDPPLLYYHLSKEKTEEEDK